MINCIIRDCPTTFDLEDSPRPEDMGSHVTVEFSNIEGGQAAADVSSNSTLTWGTGNIDVDPLFADLAGEDFRLTAGSPCIDAGTLVSALAPDLATLLVDDFENTPRPLDGDGDGTPGVDMGAWEFLLPTADSNGDGIPDGWSHEHGIDPTDPGVAAENPDNDPHTTGEEWLADTDPNDPESYFQLGRIGLLPTGATIEFVSSADRLYTLYESDNLRDWNDVPGQIDVPGNGGVLSLQGSDAGPAIRKFYRVAVRVP